MDKTFKKSFLQNAGFAFILQIINLIVLFVVRTFFVIKLGNDYLSINGLFTNVLSLLSFAELGIGNAIIFSLYKPIAEQDTNKIISLMSLFRKSYRVIRIVVLCLGLIFIPFLKYLIKDITLSDNVYFLFFLMLINTYFSYFAAYKKSLLIADQKNYIVSLIQQLGIVLQSIFQILTLLFLSSFSLYLIIQLFGTILINYFSSKYVDSHYLYLSNTSSSLSSSYLKEIFDNIKNIFFYKVGAVILNSTDNILISSLISTSLVGIYSNYSLIVNAINSVLMQVCNSIAASIGIHNVKNNDNTNEKVFKKIFLISFWIFGLCSICLCELLNPFIGLWLGEKYVLNYSTVVIISVVFYITGINQIPSQYRTSFGLFKEAKFVPMIASFINISLSIILGKMIGLDGIFIATIIAKLLTFNIVDPYLVYSKGFHKAFVHVFLLKVLFLLQLFLSYCLVHYVNCVFSFGGYFGFAIMSLVDVAIIIATFGINFYFCKIIRRRNYDEV